MICTACSANGGSQYLSVLVSCQEQTRDSRDVPINGTGHSMLAWPSKIISEKKEIEARTLEFVPASVTDFLVSPTYPKCMCQLLSWVVWRDVVFSNHLLEYSVSSVPQWDLPFVLKALSSRLFKPTGQIPLRSFIKKKSLLALTSAQRVNNLCILSVHLSCSAYQNLSSTILT